jgi:hypothetical protein
VATAEAYGEATSACTEEVGGAPTEPTAPAGSTPPTETTG